jgi:hypothetical protein
MTVKQQHITLEFKTDFQLEVFHNCIEEKGSIVIGAEDADSVVIINIPPEEVPGFAQALLNEIEVHASHQADTAAEVAEATNELEKIANEAGEDDAAWEGEARRDVNEKDAGDA